MQLRQVDEIIEARNETTILIGRTIVHKLTYPQNCVFY